MSSLFQSRKFLTLLLDTVVALITFLGGIYFESDVKNILTLVGILQPVFIAMIAAIAHEEGKLIQATGGPSRNA